MDKDRETIGLTNAADDALRTLEATGWFADGQDAARFSLAFAMREGVAEGHLSDTETRWSAGLFDRTGELRTLILALYPQSRTPIRLMEFLVNEGLRLVSAEIRNGATPIDLMESGDP